MTHKNNVRQQQKKNFASRCVVLKINWLEGYAFQQSSLISLLPRCQTLCFREGLPDTGDMVWFIIPIVLGEGTTPISAPTGVPALGDACFWGGLSRSCCSTILAARSGREKSLRSKLQFASANALHQRVHERLPLTFVLRFLGSLEVPPLCAHEPTQLTEGVVWVSGFDYCSHFTAEQDVATHVHLPLGPFLL